MGIGFSHCNAGWAYSGFHRARVRIAKEIGMDLDKMSGFHREGRGVPWTTKDSLKYLLNHSDCGGHITAKRCAKLAPRIRELVKDWREGDYDKINFLELANGCELAAKKGEELRFV